jgi:hypothetical protein
VILDRTPSPGTGDLAPDVAAFRADAGQQIAGLIEARTGSGTVVGKPRKISGGCGV